MAEPKHKSYCNYPNDPCDCGVSPMYAPGSGFSRNSKLYTRKKSDDLKPKAFTDEEMKALEKSGPPKLALWKARELADAIEFLIARFLDTIAADRKRIEELETDSDTAEKRITSLEETVHKEQKIIADQAATIEHLRCELALGKEK